MPEYMIVRVAPEVLPEFSVWTRPVHIKFVPQPDGTHEIALMNPDIKISVSDPNE